MNVRICHCRICQLATGQPFFARALFPTESVTAEGATVAFASSGDLLRKFCPSCGTLIFGERLSRPEIFVVALGTLDDPGQLPPTMHIWTSSKVPWLVLNDGLPQFPERAPA